MKNYDDFELNCKDDCDSCEVKLECEYLTADGEAKKAALTKLVERDEKEEAARKAEESAEAADEATEEAEEQTVEEQPVEEITEEVTEENGETVETEEVVDTSSPAEELAEAADEAAEEAEEQAEEEKPVEEITEEVTEENGETVETEEVIDTSSPAEELAETADEATEEAEEQAEEEKPVEEISEEVTEENGETVETEEVIDTSSPAEELAEVAEEATEATEEQAEEETAEEVEESILETAEDIDTPEEVQVEEKNEKTAEETMTEEVAEKTDEAKNEVAEQTEETTEEQTEQTEEEKPAKSAFKLTPPENLEELYAAMCTKRARKLIFRPAEAIYDKTFKVLGTDKKNEEGIKVKDILDAEIKQGVKLGYIDKFDGLKTSEIKEEYENDVVYEYAEQEFKKVGLIYDGKKIKVYVYDFDGKACHHVGYIDETEAADVIPYLIDKEKYSFALDGIITGGKAKRVTKDENGKITITKEKDGDIGLELDVTIIPRKD